MSTRFPCTPDTPACAPASRVPRAVWIYFTESAGDSTHAGGDLLFDAANRRGFLAWCTQRNVTELYLDAAGLPGCDSGANATTKAALTAFITELDTQGVDVQLLTGDSLGSGCPDGQCRFLECTRAAVALAGELDRQRPAALKMDDDGQAAPCALDGQLHTSSNLASHDLRHLQLGTVAACQLECCKEHGCGGFTFALHVNWASGECPLGSPCCFLKTLQSSKAQLTPTATVTSGLVKAGRSPGPPPPRPRPPPPPAPCSAEREHLLCAQRPRCWWDAGRCVSTPIAPKGGGRCSNSTDCFGGGDCVSGTCRCDPTWTSPNCEHLDLLPIEAERPGYPVNGPGPERPQLPT